MLNRRVVMDTKGKVHKRVEHSSRTWSSCELTTKQSSGVSVFVMCWKGSVDATK